MFGNTQQSENFEDLWCIIHICFRSTSLIILFCPRQIQKTKKIHIDGNLWNKTITDTTHQIFLTCTNTETKQVTQYLYKYISRNNGDIMTHEQEIQKGFSLPVRSSYLTIVSFSNYFESAQISYQFNDAN